MSYLVYVYIIIGTYIQTFNFQVYYKTGDVVVCNTLFSKWGTIYFLVLCFGIPILVNGFCHASIALVLGKSIKAGSQLRDKLVSIFTI